MMFNRQEVFRALAMRFPGANKVELKQFVDDGYSGDVDEEEFAAMLAAWLEREEFECRRAMKAG